jgi:5'-3' exonuclease
VIVHLVDGTYEIFRQYYAPRPGHLDSAGIEIGATRDVVQSVFTMLQDGATHIGVATDHVIESFRNDIWPTYKSSAGMDPLLLAQFGWLEDALQALGVAVWPMVDVEADDGLASAAVVAAADSRVEQVIICSPDKDLGQCVGGKVVQLDRRQNKWIDADGVIAKFGVPAESIPDWLALVGDSADGFPGLPGFGAKSAATLLSRYGHLENIPADATDWDVTVRGAATLAATLAAQRANAETFKGLATVRTDAVVGTVDGPDRGLPGLVRAIWPAASGRPGRRLGRRAHIVTTWRLTRWQTPRRIRNGAGLGGGSEHASAPLARCVYPPARPRRRLASLSSSRRALPCASSSALRSIRLDPRIQAKNPASGTLELEVGDGATDHLHVRLRHPR